MVVNDSLISITPTDSARTDPSPVSDIGSATRLLRGLDRLD